MSPTPSYTGPATPALAGEVLSLFHPMRPFGATTLTYEERALERIRIGSLRFTGWTFAGGSVRVLRSQGHCAGHVIVHLRDCGVLHLSDEGNGPCGAMADADQLKIQTVLGAVARLFEEGEAALLTDGHTFAVRRGAEVVSYLDGLLEQATALQEAALGLTSRGVDAPWSRPTLRNPAPVPSRPGHGDRRSRDASAGS
ncbi:hypothetical protein J7F03_31030 [Streptomyces sp. ISL-43]|uniref:hypothetical protein n=1 Tax=Streptomyces sp. ISL-43 TaxID=2819183 RepID=UPI001BE60EC5|nr:hypothetical protein [Streptomyces sp. ISL-43]MBT2451421.1 hypothetical protein [Streptomyces sp. ISL-43]